MNVTLDPRLQKDCFVLGKLELCQLLLMNNAAFPWFVLVPETTQIEVCDLTGSEQTLLWEEVNSIAEFVRANFQIDKLNIGAIGNVVSQLHVHVVGRREDDYCWSNKAAVVGSILPKFCALAINGNNITTLTKNNLIA